ncbi:MAG: hypothetical protein O3B45_08185 [Bacteroidetes bacterium]|nr:hypothetical protein [Bacteroidota bacterium]
MQYPAKVLLAWGEAISGNRQLLDWLMKNGYEELGMTCHAIRLVDTARAWLMSNGQPHLMALVNGAEGNKNAVVWLRQYGYTYLADMALGADNDDDAIQRLIAAEQREWAGVALKIRSVKNQIEERHNDVHSLSPD